MLVSLFNQKQKTLINIVDNPDQVKILQQEYNGEVEHILDSSEEDFENKLKEKFEEFEVTVALDCVGGEITGKLLNIMGQNAVLISYGQMSGKPIGPIDTVTFLAKNQRIEPFILPLSDQGEFTEECLGATQPWGGSIR